MAYLLVTAGPDSGKKHFLSAGKTYLGRHPACDVVVTNVAVQRYHALVLEIDGGFFLEGLMSRNGTYLNGKLIEDRAKLEDGDVISVADVEVGVFHL
jgi:pSer/pThr/pTyr-binding forkhead associated (FHA) protein